MKTVPERLAALEERVRYIAEDMSEVRKHLDEIRSIIQQGKGAKWVIVGMATVLGSGLGAVAHKILGF